MNEFYQLRIIKDKHEWCLITIKKRNSNAAIADIQRRFPKEEGFSCHLQEQVGEKRILLSDQHGIKLLASEIIFASSCAPSCIPGGE